MADMNLVEPNASAAPEAPAVDPNAPAPAPESAPAEGTPKLSDDLLKIPAMQAIFAGSPSAFSATLEEFKKRPEAKLIADHKDELLKSGFGLYRSLDGQTGVVMNLLHIHPEEVKAADQAGQLMQIAPPFDTVNEAVSKSGANNPVLNQSHQPVAFKGAPAPPEAAMPSPNAPQVPAAVQKRIAGARAQNLQGGAPTSGPVAGQGRLLASILKPVL